MEVDGGVPAAGQRDKIALDAPDAVPGQWRNVDCGNAYHAMRADDGGFSLWPKARVRTTGSLPNQLPFQVRRCRYTWRVPGLDGG